MTKLFYSALLLLLTTSFQSFSNPGGGKKCSCDEDAIFNRETEDATWNKYIHEACASIQNKEYESAYTALENALKIGEDAYIQALYNCVKAMKGTTTSETPKKEEPKKEAKAEPKPDASSEAVGLAPPPPPETPPVKEEVKTEPAPTPKATPVASNAPIPEVTVEDKPREGKVFTNEELASFQAKGMIKVNTFKNYLNKIGNKSTSQSEGLDAIKNALKLFYGSTYVQVSSTNRDTKPKFPTKTYLERVKALNYDNVEIEWAECQYTQNLRKAPDGNYYGYIKFRQRFRGIKDGKVVYEDVTDKTISVILKAYDKAIEGETVENFDIFLGDIDVVQTMKN